MPPEKTMQDTTHHEECSPGFLQGREGTVFLKNVQQRYALEYADAWGFFDLSGLCLRSSLLSEAPELAFLRHFQGHYLRHLLSPELEGNMLFYLRYATQREDPLFRIFEYERSRETHSFVIIFLHTPFVTAGKQIIAFFIQEIPAAEGPLFLEEEHEAFRRNEVIRDIQRHRKLTPWTERELLFLGLSPETSYITCLVERQKSSLEGEKADPLWSQRLSRCLLRERGFFCWNFHKKLGVLLPQKEGALPSRKNQKDQGFLLLTLCREFFPEGSFLVGLAGKPRSLDEFCTSLGEAERACQGSLFGRKEPIVHFEELGYGALLDPRALRWKSFVQQTLEPLLGEEEKNATLLESLEALLEYPSIPDAARALHVHPNTLSYRKRQIEKLLERDLQDPHVRTNLLLALKAHRLQHMEEGESHS